MTAPQMISAPAQAESVKGWRPASACGGPTNDALLVVTDYALRRQGESGRIARMYKTGNDLHIQAKCRGAYGERSIPVALRLRAERLQLNWDRVAAGELQRCP